MEFSPPTKKKKKTKKQNNNKKKNHCKFIACALQYFCPSLVPIVLTSKKEINDFNQKKIKIK